MISAVRKVKYSNVTETYMTEQTALDKAIRKVSPKVVIFEKKQAVQRSGERLFKAQGAGTAGLGKQRV